jgi:hypothetical protein
MSRDKSINDFLLIPRQHQAIERALIERDFLDRIAAINQPIISKTPDMF